MNTKAEDYVKSKTNNNFKTPSLSEQKDQKEQSKVEGLTEEEQLELFADIIISVLLKQHQ